MPDDVKISEMSEEASLDNSAQFPYVQSMNGNLTTLKAPLSQIGTKLNEGMTFSNLKTTSKTIVGAINEIDTKTTLVKSASGSLIHITDGGDNIPLKSCEIEIAPDLTGHTEANLVVCGKNLCPYIETGAINQTTGEETPNNDLKRTGFIRVKPNLIYYLSHFTSVNANTRLFYYDENKQYLRTETLTVFPNGQPKKMPIDTYYLRLQAYSYFYDYSNIQVEEGSTGSNYENYLGTTYNIPFGQTVTAGGTLDVISGELVVGGVTTQLTPVSPKTISGVNNIYNDCGDTAIEYFTSSADGLAALIEVLSNS